jgi:DNA-binding NarL/FixJ family response regulator
MRIILVGRPADRVRLRAELDQAGIEVVGEFDTIAEARATTIRADAVMLARGTERLDVLEREDEWIDDPLTAREIDVLELLAEGLPNKTIAERLGISDQTVKFHVASILAKLGAANRTEAVRLAVRRGLISL